MNTRTLRATLLPLLALLGAAGCQNATPTTSSSSSNQTPDEPPARPKFVIADTTYTMGEADIGQTATSSVRVANEGTAPLRITLIEKSCHCGDVEVPTGEIPPDGEGKVVVKWTPSPGQRGTFLLAVKLGTNDPDLPQYRIELTGRVTPLIRILPEDRGFLDFRTIKPGKAVEREIKVVSSRLKAFDLEASTTLAELKPVVTKLTPDAAVEEYLSGYVVRVRTSEGLPVGYLQDRLTLKIKVPEGESWTVVAADLRRGRERYLPGAAAQIVFQKKSVTEADLEMVPRPVLRAIERRAAPGRAPRAGLFDLRRAEADQNRTVGIFGAPAGRQRRSREVSTRRLLRGPYLPAHSPE